MTVRVRPFAASGNPTGDTQFSDNFTRADSSTLGANWMRLLAHATSSTGITACATDSISTNNCLIGGSGQLNPVAFYETLFTPSPVYASLYNADQTFVEWTGVSLSGAIAIGACLRFNTDLRTGIGAKDYDAYFFGFDGSCTRITSTGSSSIQGSQGWAFGNKVRFNVSGQGSTVTIRTFLNGAAGAVITDTNASRILNGVPGLLVTTESGNTATIGVRFSQMACGLGA